MSKLTINEKNLCSLDKQILARTLLERAEHDPMFERRLRYDLLVKHDPYDLASYIRRRCRSWRYPEGLREPLHSIDNELKAEIDQYITWLPEVVSIDPHDGGETVFDLIGWVLRLDSYYKGTVNRFAERGIDKILISLKAHWVDILTTHPLDPVTFVNYFLALPGYGRPLLKIMHKLGEELWSGETNQLLVQRLSQMITTLEALKLPDRATLNPGDRVSGAYYDDSQGWHVDAEAEDSELQQKIAQLRQLRDMHAVLAIYMPGGAEEYLEPFLKKYGSPDGMILAVNELYHKAAGLGVRQLLPRQHPLPLEMIKPTYARYKKYVGILIALGEYREGIRLHFELLKTAPLDQHADVFIGDLRYVLKHTPAEAHIGEEIFDHLKKECLKDTLYFRAALYLWTKFPQQMGGDEYFNKLIFLRQDQIGRTSVKVWQWFMGSDGWVKGPDDHNSCFNYHSEATLVSWYLIHQNIVAATYVHWLLSSQYQYTKKYYSYIASRLLDLRRLYAQIPKQKTKEFELKSPEVFEREFCPQKCQFRKIVFERLDHITEGQEVKISTGTTSTYFPVPKLRFPRY